MPDSADRTHVRTLNSKQQIFPSSQRPSVGTWVAAKRLIAQSRIPYRGISLEVSSRLGGALAFVLVGLTLILAPFEPPLNVPDALGWAILGSCVAAWLVVGIALTAGYWVQSPNLLLLSSYIATVLIAALVWVGGGTESLYPNLSIIPLVCVAAIHPLGRWIAYYLFLSLMTFTPVLYDSPDAKFFGTGIIELILGLGLGFVILLMMSDVRAQRRQLELEQGEASRLARLDSLTGLGNQRGFWEAIHSEVAHAHRTYRPLSIVLADLDHFKRVNDQFGHREGDELLARVGVALARTARTSDKCFRYGGEEFVVILRDVDMAGSVIAAERFRAAVSELNSPAGSVTMSCGVAELEAEMDAEALLRTADSALLSAKGEGRDKVVSSPVDTTIEH